MKLEAINTYTKNIGNTKNIQAGKVIINEETAGKESKNVPKEAENASKEAKIATKDADKKTDSLGMVVSPICHNEKGEKYAYVSFSDDEREAEGKIPDCKIEKNKGFTDEEIAQLEQYMRENVMQLKNMAAGVNVMKAFMGTKAK